MRSGVKAFVAIKLCHTDLVDIGSGIEEAFGPEVVSGTGALIERKTKSLYERINGMIALC